MSRNSGEKTWRILLDTEILWAEVTIRKLSLSSLVMASSISSQNWGWLTDWRLTFTFKMRFDMT